MSARDGFDVGPGLDDEGHGFIESKLSSSPDIDDEGVGFLSLILSLQSLPCFSVGALMGFERWMNELTRFE